jgi:glycosyltransferase involved in cell wall biosynthesis
VTALPVAPVDVVVTSYNHARFLREALGSVLGQTRMPSATIVVDDGSEDEPEQVATEFSGVRLIRQVNLGLSAARNTGLRAAMSPFVVFLDADDRLEPNALSAGLEAFERFSAAAFVYGAHRRFRDSNGARGLSTLRPMGADPYADFLRGNPIGMHGTVMYRRELLLAAGGFDETLRRCEDYDVYLRLSRTHSVASHAALVAEYRWHGANMSHDHAAMLRAVLSVHARQERFARQRGVHERAWLEGGRYWRAHYFDEMLDAAKDELRDGRIAGGAVRVLRALGDNPREVLPKLRRVAQKKLFSRLCGPTA